MTEDLTFVKDFPFEFTVSNTDTSAFPTQLFIYTEDFVISLDYDGYFSVRDESSSNDYQKYAHVNELFFDNTENDLYLDLFHMPKQKTKQSILNYFTVLYLYKRFFGI